MGAWLADGSYFLLGYSVWWLVLACAAAWLASLAGWMRAGQPRSVQVRRRALFWAGLALLLLASTALEWSRLYRFEGGLPGHAGGVLGFVTGPAAVKWLGFTGSGLAGVVLMVVAVGWVFGFSWGAWRRRWARPSMAWRSGPKCAASARVTKRRDAARPASARR